MKTRLLLTLVVCGSMTLAAQQRVPERAIAAESSDRWRDAAAAYMEVLAQEPQRTDLWLRLADVYARLDEMPACIAALSKAAETSPRDASIHVRLSRAHAQAGQPASARSAIDRALALEPDNRDALVARAKLSTWLGDYGSAAADYRRLLRIGADDQMLVALARVLTWAGDTDEAAALYARYTRARGPEADVLLDWARAESFRGNTAGALARLATYRKAFGETPAYLQEAATVLARGDRPGEAKTLLHRLQGAGGAAGTDMQVLNVLVQAMAGRQREAYAGLNELRQSDAASAEAARLAPLLQTLFSGGVTPGASAYNDSDGLRATVLAPQVSVPVLPELRAEAGFERIDLRARSGSGLEQTSGTTGAMQQNVWGGVSIKIRPEAQVTARAGQAKTEGKQIATYLVAASVRARDGLQMQAAREFGFLSVSPRTLGLGITRTANRASLSFALGSRYFMDAQASHQAFSDGNRRWEMLFAPRRAVVRSSWLNLDLGASAYQMRTLRNLDNGYYDPARYEFYAFTAFPYWKISNNNGVGLMMAVGGQRATPFDAPPGRFQLGGSLAVEATFGIYRSWMLKAQGAVTRNQRLETGAYSGVRAGVSLTRRF